MVKGHKHYNIVSVANHKALDGNIGACHDKSHPRPFLWDLVSSAPNHQWQFKHVEGDYYMIVNKANGKALDGNVAVPQTQSSHPAPFLWDQTPHSHNHQWKLHKVDKKTFVITNRSNGKALDANFGGCTQAHPSHPTPFLWDPVHHAANHRWKLVKAH